jgi:hypothetical protein
MFELKRNGCNCIPSVSRASLTVSELPIYGPPTSSYPWGHLPPLTSAQRPATSAHLSGGSHAVVSAQGTTFVYYPQDPWLQISAAPSHAKHKTLVVLYHTLKPMLDRTACNLGQRRFQEGILTALSGAALKPGFGF